MSTESDDGELRYGIESAVQDGDHWVLEDYIFRTRKAARIAAVRLNHSGRRDWEKFRPVRVRLVRVK